MHARRETFRLEYVSCGKSRCRCAHGGAALHGPYWYAYWRTGHGPDSKVHKRYVGKNRDKDRRADPGNRPPRMASDYAVLEVPEGAPFQTVKAAWHRLALENHPDRGGSTERMQTINLAWARLKKRHGWN